MRVFGKHTFTYVQNIVEKGKLDYLPRLPEKIIMKIVGHLPLEDISRLSQVNNLFRQVSLVSYPSPVPIDGEV